MNNALERLAQAGIDNPAREWRILQKNFDSAALENALARRIAREPMAQILGYRDFWKDRFIVTSDVLDPRPDSELFLELAPKYHPNARSILDLGTGSGALGLSALREFADADALLVDQSCAALDIAKQNARALGLGARAQVLQSNWFENVAGRFDLIVCNPPYLTKFELETAQKELTYEPEGALSDGGDGLGAYRELAQNLASYLNPRGIALFEHGAAQQSEVANIFASHGFQVEKHQDLSQNPRIVAVFTKD